MRRAGFSVGLGILISAIIWAPPARSATLEAIGSATYSSPTYVTSDPRDPDRLFVTEQAGTIQVTTPAGTSLFLNLTDLVLDGGERGLWSMAFAPDFDQSGLFYVAYSADLPGTGSDGTIRLDEFREQGTPAATRATQREVLSITNNTATPSHNGGQLQFGPDGYLYWSVGEDENSANAQDVANLLGKILRIDPRGSGPGQYTVPADNPFVSGPPGARPEIWALGLRNPWRFSFDRATGAMYIGDVGGALVEEVNRGISGANYGWPICEGVCAPERPELTDPIYAYASDDSPCNAINGGYVVRDPDLGDLAGRYLFTDLCGGNLRTIDPAAPPPFDTYRDEGLSVQTPVSFGEDACGRVYVVAQGAGSDAGRVYRIEGPADGACIGSPGGPGPDIEPPQTTVKLKAANRSRTRMAARLRSNEPGSTFECKLDKRKWKACGAKRKLKHLDAGRHRFRARATDAAGNTDPSPAKRRFKTRA